MTDEDEDDFARRAGYSERRVAQMREARESFRRPTYWLQLASMLLSNLVFQVLDPDLGFLWAACAAFSVLAAGLVTAHAHSRRRSG